MSAQNTKDAADDWVARARLPDRGDGRKLQLVIFQNDQDCLFFYPRRVLTWQQKVNTFISRAVRVRGIRVQRICITPAEYHKWRGDRVDTQALRREYADSFQVLIEAA